MHALMIATIGAMACFVVGFVTGFRAGGVPSWEAGSGPLQPGNQAQRVFWPCSRCGTTVKCAEAMTCARTARSV